MQDQSLNEAEAIYNASNWISYESTDSQDPGMVFQTFPTRRFHNDDSLN